MPIYTAPGVYVEERSTGARPIAGVSTSTGAFIGVAERGPVGRATLVTGFAEFVRRYGGPMPIAPGVREHYLHHVVRHFFEHGGTRCYVVRVAHYGNINNPASVTAAPASEQFPAQDVDGVAVADALLVSAISPGTWGTTLQVAVAATSRFQLPLAETVAAATDATAFNLPPNTDVVPGTVLYLVHEITGVVANLGHDTANPTAVAFAGPLVQAGASSTAAIPVGAFAFSPDFSVMTTTMTAIDLNAANPPADSAVQLDSIAGLSPGEPLHFVVDHALVVVQSVEATMVGSDPAMRVVVADPPGIELPALPVDATRVYARDFALIVVLDEEVVETHANLSLVAAHPSDYVNTRLGPESGASQYIVAAEPSPGPDDDIVMSNTTFTPLAGGSDGLTDLSVADFVGSELARNGLHALDAIEDASILVVGHSRMTSAAEPDHVVHQQNLTAATIAWVENRRDMFHVIDPPRTAGTDPVQTVRDFRGNIGSTSYAGIYFPWIGIGDPLTGQPVIVPPSGAVAGILARSDARRGVHKAPAGLDVGRVSRVTHTGHIVTRGDNDVLYPENINAIRTLTQGIVVWGSRTISADPLWQQINIRRLFIFLERSIELGTQWVVFEPNDRVLWKTIERSVKSFLRIQWIEGKLVGATEGKAFFVRCNEETNPPDVVAAGQVITEIGVAPSRPAEFVVFRIRQFAGLPS